MTQTTMTEMTMQTMMQTSTRESAPLCNDAKWGASEGKAVTPEDSSHLQKELSMNCEMKSDV